MRLPVGLPAVSPVAFRRLAVFAAIAMGLLVVSGAAVRLTDSGLGCDTWPRCTATSVVAPASFHGMVEFGNRVLSTVIGIYGGVAALARVPQLHADAALLLPGLVVATLFAVRLTDASDVVRRRAPLLTAAIGVQVAIGYTQYFLNLPPGVVELHVAGATLLWSATLWLQLGFTAPTPPPAPVPVQEASSARWVSTSSKPIAS